MIIADGDIEELREALTLAEVGFFEVFKEPLGAGDVGNVGVIGREFKASVIVQYFGHGHVVRIERAGF